MDSLNVVTQTNDYDAQPNLYVQVKRSPKNKKKMTNKVFLQPEGTEEVHTFFMASPSPVKPTAAASDSSSAASPAFEPTSPASLMPEDFMAEIDSLANDISMSEFPTVFYTPRVPTLNPVTPDFLPNGPGPATSLANSVIWVEHAIIMQINGSFPLRN